MAKTTQIAKFNIDFTATSKALTQRMKKIKKDIGDLSTGIKIGLAGAAVAAGAAIFNLTKRVVALAKRIAVDLARAIMKASGEIDDMAKKSKLLGVELKSLQDLSLAGNLSGIDDRTLTMAIQRMRRRISEAVRGTGEGRTGLDLLGLNASELAGQTLDEQLRSIARGLSGVANQARRIDIANKFFDSEGVQLVKLLNENFDGTLARVKALNISLSATDAAQVELMNDSFSEINAQMKSFINQLTVDLAPAISGVVRRLSDIMRVLDFRGFFEVAGAFLSQFFTTLTEGLRQVSRLVLLNLQIINKLNPALRLLGFDIGKQLNDLRNELATPIRPFRAFVPPARVIPPLLPPGAGTDPAGKPKPTETSKPPKPKETKDIVRAAVTATAGFLQRGTVEAASFRNRGFMLTRDALKEAKKQTRLAETQRELLAQIARQQPQPVPDF